jgi:putative tricarboxylic transport membrane protein
MWGNILLGLSHVFTFESLLFINAGLFVGIIFGALPGLTATMGVALFLPVTFGMHPINGLLLLLGIYCGGIYGGSITAILIKTPGTPASAATVLDGYVLAQNGHAGKALDIALIASTVGGIFSALMLLFLAPQVARAALKFGSPEKFMLAMFGLSVIASISGKDIFKGFLSACIGLFAACIGLDPIEALPRFNFGVMYFMRGIDIIPALIGLFAICEILNKTAMTEVQIGEKGKNFAKEYMTFQEFKATFIDMIKSSFIGVVIGATPGTGATTASFLSYMEARRSSKTPEKFGTGYINGIAAAEAGNNGVTGATLIPLLTLGIPGDTVTAVMLGALMMQGLTPGPRLFQTQAAVMYTIMVGMIFINFFMLLQGKVFQKLFINITRVPSSLLAALLTVLCVVGGFSVNNTSFDVYLMLFFALLGYFINRLDLPIVPLLLGIILGPMAEENLRKSLILSDGSLSIFITKPIACAFLVLTLCSFIVPIVVNILKFHRSIKKTRGA